MLLLPGLHRNFDQAAIGKWKVIAGRIENLGSGLTSISDVELHKKSLALRYQALSGQPLDELIVEAYALVRESARRTIGMQHYPVQLLGGIAMHFGSIAVMQTGEGKTLTATLPMYLASLTECGAHLTTANDYLAARDAELMRPVYMALGVSLGVVESDTSRPDRQAAYASDITYSTAKEIGFDFLRDRLFHRSMREGNAGLIQSMVSEKATDSAFKPVQRDPEFMLVDEADSILIDEARTPLIVASVPDQLALAKMDLYRWTAERATEFELDLDFESDPKTNQIQLTAAGRRKVRRLPQPELLKQTPVIDIYDQLEQAIFVERNYKRDRHYVIRDNEVVIVDEFTGRLAEGRKWRSGLHQAIEAREKLEISVETGEAARITIQDLFLRYPRVAGMTGTAANSAPELRKIYDLKVVNVPTNRPPKRVQLPDQVYGMEEQKWLAIADEVETMNVAGRPVLVGTRSIDKSEILSKILTERKIIHDVLNARHLSREAEIVAGAGEVARVTVATNMAGRGTDIKISPAALELGGLHVICSELHESARIDRQLIGRCGRQGDPGTYRQFLSLEDDILANGLGQQRAEKLLAYQKETSQSLHRFANLFRIAQAKIERKHFQARKMLLHQEKGRQEMQREMGQDPYLDTAGA